MLTTEHIHIDPAFRARLHINGLGTAAAVLRRIDDRVVAWSRTTDTLYVPGVDELPGFYIKRHFYPTWTRRLRGALRGTFFRAHRGKTEFAALQALRQAGLSAVRPVAYGGRRCARFLEACFLITEEVPETHNLALLAQEAHLGQRQLSRHQRQELLAGLAEQIAALHGAGLHHGNLYWRNILTRSGPDGRGEFFLLDPEPHRARRGGEVPLWLRELSQLAVSAGFFTTRTERFRFLRRYSELRSETERRELRRRAAQIEQRAVDGHEHEARRIRLGGLFNRWNLLLDEEASSPAPTKAEGLA